PAARSRRRVPEADRADGPARAPAPEVGRGLDRAGGDAVAEWIYFIHPPREDFAATMTEAEQEVWARHWERIQRLYEDGSIILVGPTLGRTNTGICVFEAPDEAAARAFMDEDP